MDKFEMTGRLQSAFGERARQIEGRVLMAVTRLRRDMRVALAETSGQGTTEYAILVGVLVLMAIVAVVAFRGKLQELWTSITDGINSL
jgi:Flp pilus assembly pilin Flp